MFRKQYKGLIVVHDNEIFWSSNDPTLENRFLLRVPIDEVLNNTMSMDQIPESLQGNYKTLCIIPDHWFGKERYPFRSTRPSLIESFLERKLAATFPQQKAIKHFFSYRCVAAEKDADSLYAYFLQEDKGYQLYETLHQLNLAPQRITTPAFLWEEKMCQTVDGFNQQGALLIHMIGQQCLLYFYFNGNYLFSRSVMLPDTADSLDTLIFEINQSLYMFSQKTKTELKRIYLLAGGSTDASALGEALERETIDLDPIAVQGAKAFAIPEVPVLNGLLQQTDMNQSAPFISVIHRQVKMELDWKPVQWAGIIIGIFLLLLLLAENLFIHTIIRAVNVEYRSIQQQVNHHDGVMLADYENALDRVLYMSERPACAEAVHRLLVSLPSGVWLKELKLALGTEPTMKFAAIVPAADMVHLRAVLVKLIAQLKENFQTAQSFSLNDIDIRADQSEGEWTMPRYWIGFELDLI